MVSKLRIGVITSTHGLKGEVKVYPTTDDAARYKKLKEVILEAKRETRELTVERVSFFKQLGIDNINDIEKYKGKSLLVPREDAVPLGDDEYYIADLIGLPVISDTGERLGVIRDVLQTGANDVYEVEREGKKPLLLPVTRECVLDVDLLKSQVLVHVLDGLLDL